MPILNNKAAANIFFMFIRMSLICSRFSKKSVWPMNFLKYKHFLWNQYVIEAYPRVILPGCRFLAAFLTRDLDALLLHPAMVAAFAPAR